MPHRPLKIDTERTIQRRNSSLDEDTTDVLAHLEASPSPKGKRARSRAPLDGIGCRPATSRRRTTTSRPSSRGAEGRLPRLLPEGDRAALIERLRTDLFGATGFRVISFTEKTGIPVTTDARLYHR